MSKIDELIQQYCPDGVEYVKLGEVCSVLRGKRLTKSQLTQNGKYMVFHGGTDPIGFYDDFNREGGTTMIINVGASAGTVGYSIDNFWSADESGYVLINEILEGSPLKNSDVKVGDIIVAVDDIDVGMLLILVCFHICLIKNHLLIFYLLILFYY